MSKSLDREFFPFSSEKAALQFSEAIPVGTYIMKVDPDGVESFTFVSERFLDMLGLGRREALSDPNYIYQRVHPDDYEDMLNKSLAAQKNNQVFYWEGRMIIRGETRWFLCESTPRKASDNSVIWEGAVTDITRIKLAEFALLRKQQESIDLMMNTPFPMALNSIDDESITFLNAAFTDLFGYTQREIPTISDWARLAYPNEDYRKEVLGWWRDAVKDYLENGIEIPKKIFQIRAKSGADLEVEIAASLLNNHLILSFHDVTEQRNATRKLCEVHQKSIYDALKTEETNRSLMLSILTSLAMERDNETGSHIIRTQKYVERIALRLNEMGHPAYKLSVEVIKHIADAAPLHDIGKVGIPDAILKKPGKLTEDEWSIMKTHPIIGERILSAHQIQENVQHGVLHAAIQIAGNHHEKWDGSGYPRGLQGEDIPLAARIMAVADVYDALANRRVYKDRWSHGAAVDKIVEIQGSHLDPIVVDAFLLELDQVEAIAKEYSD